MTEKIKSKQEITPNTGPKTRVTNKQLTEKQNKATEPKWYEREKTCKANHKLKTLWWCVQVRESVDKCRETGKN